MIESGRNTGLEKLLASGQPSEGVSLKPLCDIRLRRVILETQFRISDKSAAGLDQPQMNENGPSPSIYSPRLPDKDTLQRLLTNRVPQTEIARMFGVTQKKISELKTSYRILVNNSRRYPYIEVEDWVRIVHRYLHVHNYEVVAKQLNFSRYDVEDLLHNLGVMQTRRDVGIHLKEHRKGVVSNARRKPALTERYYTAINLLAEELPSASWITQSLNLSEEDVQKYLHRTGKILPRNQAISKALRWKFAQKKLDDTTGQFSEDLTEYQYLLAHVVSNGNEITVSQLREISANFPRLRLPQLVIALVNQGVLIKE